MGRLKLEPTTAFCKMNQNELRSTIALVDVTVSSHFVNRVSFFSRRKTESGDNKKKKKKKRTWRACCWSIKIGGATGPGAGISAEAEPASACVDPCHGGRTWATTVSIRFRDIAHYLCRWAISCGIVAILIGNRKRERSPATVAAAAAAGGGGAAVPVSLRTTLPTRLPYQIGPTVSSSVHTQHTTHCLVVVLF